MTAALLILAALMAPPVAKPERCHWQTTTLLHPDDPLGFELTMRQWICDDSKPKDNKPR